MSLKSNFTKAIERKLTALRRQVLEQGVASHESAIDASKNRGCRAYRTPSASKSAGNHIFDCPRCNGR